MDAGEWPNYTFLVGATPYINGCSYDNTDPYFPNLPVSQGGCGLGICEGYYNPAEAGYGTCDYYQAPDQDDITFTVSDTGILVDWSAFLAPENAIISGYNVSRCTGGCEFITGTPFQDGWENNTNYCTDPLIFDEFDWAADLAACDECGGQVKYSINVKYSNAEDYGMAISTSYVTPDESSCPELGDLNADSSFNVLDIVSLANCVLANNCDDIEDGCAGDMNGDGTWNVLDIVTLANCVLASNCDDL
jgi:hypothetical protein